MNCMNRARGQNKNDKLESEDNINMPSRRARTRNKTKNLLKRCIRNTLSRPEQLTVSQWAGKYRILDESSSLPGHWNNLITPYLVGIMDCFNDPYIHYINFVKSTQVGGTEALINATGWIITKNPSPTMIVYPTDDLAKDVSRDKLQPAYQKTPEISERFQKTKSSEQNLRFKNMNIYLRSGGSPSKLASKAIKYLFFDEIDKMAGASKKEASPYNLAVERTKTFKHSRKIYTCSTPTHRENYVWKIHERADEQRYYFVPCPHCGEMILLEWEQIKFENNDDKKMTNTERANTAMYFCQECGSAISDKEKINMLRRGEWRDVKKTCVGKPQSVSFHINALYSFFVSWSDIVAEFLETKSDPEALQNFINSWLGEPWEDTKLKTTADLVIERRASEPEGIVPDWAEMITAGVDVQRNSIYFDIVAWGAKLTSQSIMHGQLLSFNELETYMNAEYFKTTGEAFVVDLCLIDSGDQTDAVYEFCMLNEWAIPSKGVATNNNHYKVSRINRVGAKYDGQPLVLVDVGKYKDMIATRLHEENGEGSCMVHADCDVEYAKQLTAEHKVAEGTGARRRLIWKPKTSHADNHYLDCRVYASAAADIQGVRALSIPVKPEEQSNTADKPKKPKNSWLTGY